VSLRDQILKAKDISSELMEIKEWEVTVEIRTMTARERATLMENALDPNTGQVIMSKVYPEVAIATVYDPETGKPVFDKSDIDALLGKSGIIIERIAQKALQVSGLTNDETAKLGKDS